MGIKNIAIACQGGGSHAAYAAGALPALLQQFSNTELATADGRRRALADGAGEALELTGISGTSGGAVCALLAWYGFVTGGPAQAQVLLERFWDGNCAHHPNEHLVNNVAQWMGSTVDYDLKLSPYLLPLFHIESVVTRIWPLMTAFWPPLEYWMRGSFFQLRETVAPHVDFDLVAALGQFCSIPLDIKRWHTCVMEAKLFAPDTPHQQKILHQRQAIEAGIGHKLGAARWIADYIAHHHLPEDCVLRAAFSGWTEPALAFDPVSLDSLSKAVMQVSHSIPQLLIGAVDVDGGKFLAFSSEHAPEDFGITLDAVMASAALPSLFMAQVVHATDSETQEPVTISCWDGLFSQNPPIKNFVSSLSDRGKKPDGLWILQINQDRYDFSARVANRHGGVYGMSPGGTLSGGELWRRRDVLAGNLSLNQEASFIESFNQRLDDPAQRFRPHDKPIEVARIVMDGAAVAADTAAGELGLFSKFDRNPVLEQALLRHGRAKATDFLSLRADADRLCGELAHNLEAMGARPSAHMQKAYPWLPGRERIFGGLVSPDAVTLDRVPDAGPDGGAQACLYWHVGDAVVDGRTMRIKGKTYLRADGAQWHIGDTRLLEIEEKTEAPAQTALTGPQAGFGAYPAGALAGARERVGQEARGGAPH